MRTLGLLVLVALTGTAYGAMVCARPRSDGTFSTTLKLREACKGNEVEIGIVTLQPLRLFGPTTTSSSTTSTTLPTCASGGQPVGGVCWYVADTDTESCIDVCAGVGRTYDEATRTFAGSDGTLANCQAVSQAVIILGSSFSDQSGCTTGRGCSVYIDPDGYSTQRCVTPATTAVAAGGGFHRFCACS